MWKIWPDNPYGFSTNTGVLQCHLDAANSLGMSRVRRIMSWTNLEPTEGNFDPTTLAILDNEVQIAYSSHINYVFVFDSPPTWAKTTYHNGCSNISDSKLLAAVQFLLNRYNGGTVSNAFLAGIESGNEGYSDKGANDPCQGFENAVPPLQAIYPWIKSNYSNVMVGMPAHFNRLRTDIQNTHQQLYSGFYGSAKGLFDYSNYHWYGTVQNGGIYTGPDGPQQSGKDTFNQEWQDIHSVDDANGNGSIPVYCTESGVGVPGQCNCLTEANHSAFHITEFTDMINSGGVLAGINVWTIQNSASDSLIQGCGSWVGKVPTFTNIQNFIIAHPQLPTPAANKFHTFFAHR